MREQAGKVKTGVSPLLRLAIAAQFSLLALLSGLGAAFGGALDEGMDRSITRGGGSSCPSGGIDSLRFVPSSSTLQSVIAAALPLLNRDGQ